MQEPLGKYLTEAQADIKGIADGLAALGKKPADKNILLDLCRRVRGVQDSASKAGCLDIGEITLVLEGFLKNFSHGSSPVSQKAVQVALSAVESVNELLAGKQRDPDFTVEVEPVVALMEYFDFSPGAVELAAPEPVARPASPPSMEDVFLDNLISDIDSAYQSSAPSISERMAAARPPATVDDLLADISGNLMGPLKLDEGAEVGATPPQVAPPAISEELTLDLETEDKSPLVSFSPPATNLSDIPDLKLASPDDPDSVFDMEPLPPSPPPVAKATSAPPPPVASDEIVIDFGSDEITFDAISATPPVAAGSDEIVIDFDSDEITFDVEPKAPPPPPPRPVVKAASVLPPPPPRPVVKAASVPPPPPPPVVVVAEEPPAEEEEAFDMMELLDDYISSARDNITGISDGLMTLEKNPADSEALFDVFRRAHGMKGSANMIGFTDIGGVAHKLEDFLKEFHENKIPLSSDAVDVALSAMDYITKLVEGKRENQKFTMDIAPIVASMEGYFTKGKAAPTPAPAATAPADAAKEAAPAAKPAAEGSDSIRLRIDKADELIMLTGNLLSARSSIKDELGGFGKVASSKRVSREKVLDFYREINTASDLMSRAVEEMRTAIMGIRMLPVSNLFNNFPRLVRDLSRKLKKKVEFVSVGGDILLDRQIIDEMNEPLIHMIRNSLDHGLETPEERAQAGKDSMGKLTLSARNEQGKVIITLEDDGKGVNPDIVKRKAVEKGLITAERAETMTKVEAQMLIFAPSFSTRDAATDVSGRGVGMDAVKTAVEKLQGTVDLDSSVGVGTKTIIILPLTVASTKVLLLRVGGQVIGVPIAYVDSVLLAEPEQLVSAEGYSAIDYQGTQLPLFYMDYVVAQQLCSPDSMRKWFVVVVDTGLHQVAFAVADIVAQREVVVKEMPRNLRNTDLWIGAAQSPTGDMIPMLNVHSVMRSCGY